MKQWMVRLLDQPVIGSLGVMSLLLGALAVRARSSGVTVTMPVVGWMVPGWALFVIGASVCAVGMALFWRDER